MKDDFGWLMPWYFVIVLGFWTLFFDDPLICILLTLFVVFFPEIVGFILNDIWIDNPWHRKSHRETLRWGKKLECQVRYGFYEFDNRYESYKKMLKAKKRRAFFNFVKKLFFIK